MSQNESAQIRLQQALILLLDEEEFDRITVSKICKEAGVHRSTFYAYYDNQYDLLEDAYSYLNQLFRAEFQHYQADFERTDDDRLTDDVYLIPYLTFVKEHQRIYRIYLEHQRDFRHKERFDLLVSNIFTPRYHARNVTDEVKIRYMASFLWRGSRRSSWAGYRRTVLKTLPLLQMLFRPVFRKGRFNERKSTFIFSAITKQYFRASHRRDCG